MNNNHFKEINIRKLKNKNKAKKNTVKLSKILSVKYIRHGLEMWWLSC